MDHPRQSARPFALTGEQLDQLTPVELTTAVDEVNVFARSTPNTNFALVEALKERGDIVAMTGDGVNDAPALKRSDVGVAGAAIGNLRDDIGGLLVPLSAANSCGSTSSPTGHPRSPSASTATRE